MFRFGSLAVPKHPLSKPHLLNIHFIFCNFHWLLFISTFAPTLFHSCSWSIVNTMCSRHNYFFLFTTHIFGLKTVVGHNESASYKTNRHSVWQGMPVVALVMAMLAALCCVIVTKVTPLLSTAVTRGQKQMCCGLKKKARKKKKACVWNRMWKMNSSSTPIRKSWFSCHFMAIGVSLSTLRKREDDHILYKYIYLFLLQYHWKTTSKTKHTAKRCHHNIYWKRQRASAWLSLRTEHNVKMDFSSDAILVSLSKHCIT